MSTNLNRQTILVLTDFSSCARNAADYSLVLARKFHADILLFHSYFVPVSSLDNWQANDYPALREHGLFRLKQEADRLYHLSGDPVNAFQPQIEWTAEGGSVAENAGMLIAGRQNIIMVVLGGYKARNNDDFQNGTAIGEVLGQVRCPAVIVPEFKFLSD